MAGVKLMVQSGEGVLVARAPGAKPDPKVAVKIDQDVARIAGILAAAEDESLAEWLSNFLRAALKERYETFLAEERQKVQEVDSSSSTPVPRRKTSGG